MKKSVQILCIYFLINFNAVSASQQINLITLNDINLIFINVPHNVEFSKRKNDFNLSNAEAQYKKDISEFGTVIDYDFPNQITNCKKCFTDPIHTNDSINLLMVREIFSDSLIIGKRL